MSKTRVSSFRDLTVWQRAYALCPQCYKASTTFPTHELYGLTSEIRKTARSVVCNIAEGYRRRSTAEYIRFLNISLGSLGELETQLHLTTDLGYLSRIASPGLLGPLEEVGRMLLGLIRSLERKQQ